MITYKNGGKSTQIGNLIHRRSKLVEMKDCKVTPGDHVAPQHRLLVMDVWLKRPRKRKTGYEKRIRWTTLMQEGKRPRCLIE